MACQINRRHGRGEQFFGLVQQSFEPFGSQMVGERAERFRRLVEPQPAQQFTQLFRRFHPGRLPDHLFD